MKKSKDDWHSISLRQLHQRFNVNQKAGLSDSDWKNRLSKFGLNQIHVTPKKSLPAMIGENLKSVEMMMLMGSSGLSLMTGFIADALAILGVVGINVFLGVKTESSIEKVVRLTHDIDWGNYKVLRSGSEKLVSFGDLVPGDIVFLQRGQVVPADIRLAEVDSLSVDESSLTGESLPVMKNSLQGKSAHNLLLPERLNMLFQGTIVVGGSGRGLVVATGTQTVWGKIQHFAENVASEDSPLKKELSEVTLKLSKLAVGFSLANLSLDLLYGKEMIRSLQKAITLAVAAIPEGLPLASAVTLSHSVERLRKNNILVRSMKSLESFGRVNVICLDKTGTLTLNKMELSHLVYNGEIAVWDKNKKNGNSKRLIEICALNSSVNLKSLEGSSTEWSFINAAEQDGIRLDILKRKYQKIKTYHRTEFKNHIIVVHKNNLITCKGSPDEVIKFCPYHFSKNKLFPLDVNSKAEILKNNRTLSSKGLRVLGVAVQNPYWLKSAPRNEWVWLGLVALKDKLRPGARELIRKLRTLNIKAVMITGDQHHTAMTMALRIGLIDNLQAPSYSFHELEKKNESEFRQCVQEAFVFSRVSPVDKLRIVRAFQESSAVVAMTGDGVNDAPALKKADIGIVISSGGESVAKYTADVVVENPSLMALYETLREGRHVHRKIFHSAKYVVNTNLSEIFFQGIPSLFGIDSPLEAKHLLWINLLTDVFPQLAFSRSPPDKEDDEEQGPFVAQTLKSVFKDHDSWRDVGTITALTLASYLLGLKSHKNSPDNIYAKTAAFITANLSQLLYAEKILSEKTVEKMSYEDRCNKLLPVITPSLGLLLLPFLIPSMGGLLQLKRPPKFSTIISILLGIGPFVFNSDQEAIRRYPKNRRTYVFSTN